MNTVLDFEPIWSELLGQPEAISQLRQAVSNKDAGLQHAWLLTGPPGSGRSNAAAAFAAALLCGDAGCGQCKSCRMVMSGSHPDVSVLATEKVIISIEEVRQLVTSSHFGGSVGKHQIMIIEDADRMSERSSNVLLKALEEPPAGTVWLLCAPSEADMLPTIRSRVRRVALKQPSTQTVADLLVARDGIERSLAMQVAAEAQGHIGMALRLATSSDARARRKETLLSSMQIDSIPKAMATAERWLELAKKDAEAITIERDGQERADLLATLGIPEGGTVPPGLRSDIKALEEAQKRRATRSLRDGIDRILVDLMSLYRDVLTLQLGAGAELVNQDLKNQMQELASSTTSTNTISKLEAMALARVRIGANVRDLMVLESLAIQLRRKP
ncbi:MAG: DNA polymerase III subunit delta' [Rhodoluna sp.]